MHGHYGTDRSCCKIEVLFFTSRINWAKAPLKASLAFCPELLRLEEPWHMATAPLDHQTFAAKSPAFSTYAIALALEQRIKPGRILKMAEDLRAYNTRFLINNQVFIVDEHVQVFVDSHAVSVQGSGGFGRARRPNSIHRTVTERTLYTSLGSTCVPLTSRAKPRRWRRCTLVVRNWRKRLPMVKYPNPRNLSWHHDIPL